MNFPVIVISYRDTKEIGSYCRGHYFHDATVHGDLRTKMVSSLEELAKHITSLDRSAHEQEPKFVDEDKTEYWYAHLIINKDSFEDTDVSDIGSPGEIIYPVEWCGDVETFINDYRKKEAERKAKLLREQEEQKKLKEEEQKKQQQAAQAIERENRERAELARLKEKYESK